MREVHPSSDDLVGQTVAGRYRIMSRLGAGGMGVAYRAWVEQDGFPVVIKVPRQVFLEDPRFAERFSREARLLQRLSHPHIVPILAVGEHDGRPYVVMQYLPGGSLSSRRLRDDSGVAKPNHPGMLHLWLPAIAAALDHIHAQGVVHRDVKPANIFFDAFWGAYLGDFGIAKIVEDSEAFDRELTLTATHMGIGTQEYMCPEQFTPRAVVDGRADQYALAVTVYELLAATRPFTGATAHLVVEITTAPVPPLDRRVEWLPARLVQAVHRGLAKRPGERFDSCEEFARSVLADVPPLADEPGVARLACPKCSHVIKVPTQGAGNRGRCTRCRKRLVIASDLRALWTRDEEEMIAGRTKTPWPDANVDTPVPVVHGEHVDSWSTVKPVARSAAPSVRRRLTEFQRRQVAIGLGLLVVFGVVGAVWWFWPRREYRLDHRARVLIDDRRVAAFPPRGWRRSESPVAGALESFVPRNGQPLPCIRVLLGAKPVPNAKRVPAGPYTAVLWEASPPKLAVVGKRSARVCAVKVAGRDYSVEVTVFADETDDAERLALLVAGGLTPVADERQAQVKNGLRAEYFKDRELREKFGSDTWPMVDVDWGGPPAGFPPENYAVRLTGTIVSRQEGLHTFSGMRDDGLRLTIGTDTIIDEWSDGRVAFESRPIYLIKDKPYPIHIEWYNGQGPGMFKLEWKGPIGDVELVPAECLRPGP